MVQLRVCIGRVGATHWSLRRAARRTAAFMETRRHCLLHSRTPAPCRSGLRLLAAHHELKLYTTAIRLSGPLPTAWPDAGCRSVAPPPTSAPAPQLAHMAAAPGGAAA